MSRSFLRGLPDDDSRRVGRICLGLTDDLTSIKGVLSGKGIIVKDVFDLARSRK
jgi:hypothetical protein